MELLGRRGPASVSHRLIPVAPSTHLLHSVSCILPTFQVYPELRAIFRGRESMQDMQICQYLASLSKGSPSGSAVKNLPAMQETQETWIQSLGLEDPLMEGMATLSSILPGESHGQRSLAAPVHRVAKSHTRLNWLSPLSAFSTFSHSQLMAVSV